MISEVVDMGKMNQESRERRLSEYSDVMEKEDFLRLKKALMLFDAPLDVTKEGFVCSLERYFDTLVYLLEKTIGKQSSNSDDVLIYCQAVEELYLINCEKVVRDNSYHIYSNHPILLINKRLDLETAQLLEKRNQNIVPDDGGQSVTDYEILCSVFDAKKENRREMRIYSRNMVFETKGEEESNGYVCAQPFRLSRENTRIPLIRIWEKILNYLELHPQKKGTTLRIATFGRLQKSSLYNEEQLLNNLLGVKIEQTVFHHLPMQGEYIYGDEAGEQVYDILDMIDLQSLVEHFELILFLDQNCFYRQKQAKKNVPENSEGTNCRWYFNRAQNAEQFKDKAAYFQIIYNRVGQWVNSINDVMSANFEFDEKLYQSLEAVSKENTDIYLYIRYGSKIGSINLSNNGVCNDEYYDGKPLTVCRLAKTDEQQLNKEYEIFLKESDFDNRNFYVVIRFWKLLKSISNDYCDNILSKYGDKDVERIGDLIRFFSQSYLVLQYGVHSDKEKVYIQHELRASEEKLRGSDELLLLMNNVTNVILKYAFGKEKLFCINRYFEDLVIHSVISNANDIGDLVFAHWLSTHWYETEERTEKDLSNCTITNTFSKCKNKFKVRKTAYAIIDQLEDLRMRSTPDMKGYFLGSFRAEVCPEIMPENVEKTFQLITKYCEHFKHTGSSLYVNSKLINS